MTSSQIFVESPLGDKAVILRRATMTEELGGLFELVLELSRNPSVVFKPAAVLGQTMTLGVALPSGETRYFHGYVTELAEAGYSGSLLRFQVTLRPWLWFLTRSANCRIFQDKSVPEIVKELCSELGFTDLRDALTESYRSWDYVVQYRESDFSFISRLLEQEGIYYFFEHEQSKHTLVLADGPSSHTTRAGYETVGFNPSTSDGTHEQEVIDTWQFRQQVQTGTYVLDDFDFRRPRSALQVKLQTTRPHAHSSYEVYDYPGEYDSSDQGESYVKMRLEELQAQYERLSGTGNVRGIGAGTLFSLETHPNEELNTEYLITQCEFRVDVGEHESGGEGDLTYECAMSAIKSTTTYRSPRSTPRPVIAGHQTATVVGKAGEEIWTDEYGRVKVQFPWDRKGSSNETSSCWVRVAQVWAGNGWGAMHVPRIGQEVLVSFMEGDPDRPVITGRVYNGNAMPPYDLPNKGMVSGIKSESTPGGGGYNEISFDDTKGAEKVVVHAQLDMESTIEHDKTLTVHNNRSSFIDVDDLEVVGNNQTVNVGAHQVVNIGGNSTDTIALSKALTIGLAYQVSVGATMNETVVGAKAEEVGGTKTVVVAMDSTEHAKGNKKVASDKNIAEDAKEAVTIKAGKNMELSAGADFAINGKKKGVIEIAEELTIKVGSATITLKKNGDIIINGKKLSLKASGDVVMKGQKITQN